MHSGGASSVFHRPQVPHRPLHSGAAAPQGPQRQGRVKPRSGPSARAKESAAAAMSPWRCALAPRTLAARASAGAGMRSSTSLACSGRPSRTNSLARCRASVASPGWRSLELLEQAHRALLLAGGFVEGLDPFEQHGGKTVPEPTQPDAPGCRAPAVLHETIARAHPCRHELRSLLGQRPQRPGRAAGVGLAHGGLIAETSQHVAVARQGIGAGSPEPELRLEAGGVLPASVGGIQITQSRGQPGTGRRRTPCPLERVDRGRAVAERLGGARLQIEEAG